MKVRFRIQRRWFRQDQIVLQVKVLQTFNEPAGITSEWVWRDANTEDYIRGVLDNLPPYIHAAETP